MNSITKIGLGVVGAVAGFSLGVIGALELGFHEKAYLLAFGLALAAAAAASALGLTRAAIGNSRSVFRTRGIALIAIAGSVLAALFLLALMGMQP